MYLISDHPSIFVQGKPETEGSEHSGAGDTRHTGILLPQLHKNTAASLGQLCHMKTHAEGGPRALIRTQLPVQVHDLVFIQPSHLDQTHGRFAEMQIKGTRSGLINLKLWV